MKIIIFVLFTALLASCATVRNDKASGHILDFGIVEFEKITDTYDIGDRKGAEASGLYIAQSTNSIPLKLGVSFGMSWEITGISEADEISVKYELRHPPMITKSGEVSTNIKEFLSHHVYNGKVSSIDGFHFSEEYELVPGKYFVSISYKNVYIESNFEVGM